MIIKLLLILCMLTFPACAINFNIPESTVADVATNPEYYDGTITLGTIGITGILTNISDEACISDGTFSLALDVRQSVLFDGFEEGDHVKIIGVFYHRRIGESIFVPECILHWPLADPVTVPIPELADHPSSYNGRRVTVIGNLSDIRESGMGHRIDIEDGGKHVRVIYYGGTALETGTEVKATGIFSVGMLHAETFVTHIKLPFGIPGFSGLISVFMIVFALKRRLKHAS